MVFFGLRVLPRSSSLSNCTGWIGVGGAIGDVPVGMVWGGFVLAFIVVDLVVELNQGFF